MPARLRDFDSQRQTTTLFLDRLEDLLGSTPTPLCSTDEIARFLDAYVDVLLEYLPAARLLASGPLDGGGRLSAGLDRSSGSDGRTPLSAAGWRRARAASEAVQALVAGPDANLAERVRTAVALAGLTGAVVSCPVAHVDALRSTAVASTIAALRH